VGNLVDTGAQFNDVITICEDLTGKRFCYIVDAPSNLGKKCARSIGDDGDVPIAFVESSQTSEERSCVLSNNPHRNNSGSECYELFGKPLENNSIVNFVIPSITINSELLNLSLPSSPETPYFSLGPAGVIEHFIECFPDRDPPPRRGANCVQNNAWLCLPRQSFSLPPENIPLCNRKKDTPTPDVAQEMSSLASEKFSFRARLKADVDGFRNIPIKRQVLQNQAEVRPCLRQHAIYESGANQTLGCVEFTSSFSIIKEAGILVSDIDTDKFERALNCNSRISPGTVCPYLGKVKEDDSGESAQLVPKPDVSNHQHHYRNSLQLHQPQYNRIVRNRSLDLMSTSQDDAEHSSALSSASLVDHRRGSFSCRATNDARTPGRGSTAGGVRRSTHTDAQVKRVHKQRQEKRQEKKAAKTLSAILLAFIVTWTPYNVMTVVQAFYPLSIDRTVYAVGRFII